MELSPSNAGGVLRHRVHMSHWHPAVTTPLQGEFASCTSSSMSEKVNWPATPSQVLAPQVVLPAAPSWAGSYWLGLEASQAAKACSRCTLVMRPQGHCFCWWPTWPLEQPRQVGQSVPSSGGGALMKAWFPLNRTPAPRTPALAAGGGLPPLGRPGGGGGGKGPGPALCSGGCGSRDGCEDAVLARLGGGPPSTASRRLASALLFFCGREEPTVLSLYSLASGLGLSISSTSTGGVLAKKRLLLVLSPSVCN